MLGIHGIHGTPGAAESFEPAQASVRPRGSGSAPEGPTDALEISPEAQKASRAANLMRTAQQQEAIQEEVVQQARENLEKGIHRVTGVLRLVASRITNAL